MTGSKSPQATAASIRLGAVIRARRIELGLTQQDLAEQLGLVRSRLSAMETGHIGQARLLLEVCTALGLEVLALRREDPHTAAIVTEQRRLVDQVSRRSPRQPSGGAPNPASRSPRPRSSESST